MLRLVIYKLTNKKWFTLCLLLGISFMVAVFTCHPMFEKGADNELLNRIFTDYAEEKEKYPLAFSYREAVEISEYETVESLYTAMDKREAQWEGEMTLSGLCSQQIITLSSYAADSSLEGSGWMLQISHMREMENHIRLVKGEKWETETEEKGRFGCLISESVMDAYGMVVGEELTFHHMVDDSGKPLVLVITGVFSECTEENDFFWYRGQDEFESTLFVSKETMNACMRNYRQNGISYEETRLFDSSELDWRKADSCREYAQKMLLQPDFGTDMLGLLEEYEGQRQNVARILWVLELPVVVLLLLFLSMTAEQMFDREEGEIAVYRSRGTTRKQLLKFYFYQALLLSVIGCLTGFFLGIVMCRLAAGTDAFLQFAHKDTSLYRVNEWMIPYALAAIILCVLFLTVPVWKRTKFTIVQQKGRREKKWLFWERSFLDVILLAVAGYLLFNYQGQRSVIAQNVQQGAGLDPMLFLDESLFIFACGLLVTRLSQYGYRLLFRMGERKWKPSGYAALLQITRTFASRSFLSVFLIMTIAGGVCNANMARTINQNTEWRLAHDIGCDLRIQEQWNNEIYFDKQGKRISHYEEPDFGVYSEFVREGVCESVTRVLVDEKTEVQTADHVRMECCLMGIHTKEFGETAEIMEGLNDSHWFHALNALAKEADGIIISRNLADDYQLKTGDWIDYVRYNSAVKSEDSRLGTAAARICGIVDAFPGHNRYEGKEETYLIIANYGEVLQNFGLSPYEIWMRLGDGGTSAQVREGLEKRGIQTNLWRSLEEEERESRDSALIQITNGLFTMGFLISLIVCVAGFLIYWILSIRSRALHFGIYRGMGMRMKEIYHILLGEQVCSSLIPMFLGGGIGLLATVLFVRLLALVYLPEKHTIEILLCMDSMDMLRLAGVLLFMLVACFCIIYVLVKRLKIAETLKMGED